MEPCKNVVRPTLVAMATKFEPGAEIQSPTGLSSLIFVVCSIEMVIERRLLDSCKRYRRSCDSSVRSDGQTVRKSRLAVPCRPVSSCNFGPRIVHAGKRRMQLKLEHLVSFNV